MPLMFQVRMRRVLRSCGDRRGLLVVVEEWRGLGGDVEGGREIRRRLRGGGLRDGGREDGISS